jgi:prolyl-tRNA synthetase
MIMTHSDDDGLICPPRVAPAHVVLLPIIRDESKREEIVTYCEEVAEKLKELTYHGRSLEVEIDDRDINAGERSWGWVKKGIPLRLEVGPKDMEKNSVFVGRRDRTNKERYGQDRNEFVDSVVEVLDDIQANLLARARTLQQENTVEIDTWDDFAAFFIPKNPKKPEIHGGFASAHWCGSETCENKPKTDLKVTIRCIPFDAKNEEGTCVVCGAPSEKRVIFAKSY